MHLKALALVLSVACMTTEVGAQARESGTVPLTPGSRVRVTAPTMVTPLIANFLEQRHDTLVFIEEGTGTSLWSFQLSQIQRLERTVGEAGRNRPPMARGTVIGAAVGLVSGLLFAKYASPSDTTRDYNAVLTGAVSAGVGAGVGAFLGSRVKQERWVSVPLPRQLSLRATGRGVSISYSFR